MRKIYRKLSFRITRPLGKTRSLKAAGGGVQKIAAEKEYRKQHQLLLALEKVSQVLSVDVDIHTILKDMATTVAKGLGAKWVNFWELTADKEHVAISAAYGMQRQYIQQSRDHPIEIGKAWIGRAVKTGRPWGTNDILNDPNLAKDLPTWRGSIQKQDYRALLCVPTTSKKGVVGGMCAYFPDVHEFTDFEMRLMSVAANQAATAISNAQIFRDLTAEQNKTLAMINSLGDGVMVFDLAGKIITLNPRAEQLLWIKKEDVFGKNARELNGLLWENVRTVSALHLSDFETKEMILENPQRAYIYVTALPVRDADNKKIAFMRVLHDITVEKESEQLKANFITVASHQLRTPLSGIKWALDLLYKKEYGPLVQAQEKIVGQTLQATQSLIDLVNDLLDVSRIEEGRFSFTFARHNLFELVREVVNDFSQKINECGITCTLEPTADMPYVQADPAKFKMALANVLDNAIRYTPSNGNVEVSLAQGKATLMINVRDTGIGIPEDQQKALFTKFFRARNAIHMRPEGSGLGLWIANEIIKRHNGKIWFDSKENKGSAFVIQLPMMPEAMPQSISPQEEK